MLAQATRTMRNVAQRRLAVAGDPGSCATVGLRVVLAGGASREERLEVDVTTMVEGFHYVRRVYETASQLLQASDSLVVSRGFKPFDWRGLLPYETAKFGKPNEWLYFSAQRHSRRLEQQLAIATFFFDPWSAAFSSPLCIASTFETTSGSDDIYWPPVALVWAQGGHEAGVPRDIGLDDVRANDEPFWAKLWPAVVPRGVVRSVGAPLMDICSVDDLESKLLRPLLGSV